MNQNNQRIFYQPIAKKEVLDYYIKYREGIRERITIERIIMSIATGYTTESRLPKENISYFARTIWVLWNMGLHFFAFTLLIFTLVFFTECYEKCYDRLGLGDLNELTLRITYLYYWTHGLWCVMLPLFFFFDSLMLCVLGILVNQRWVAAAWTTFMLTLIIVLQFVLSLGFVMPLFELTQKI